MFYFEDKSDDRKVVSSSCKPCGKHLRQKPQIKPNRAAAAACLFPSYDKCESLLLFPTNFAACLNSGDFGSLSKLIKSRVGKHCDIDVFDHRMDIDTLVRVFELLDELHPDSINYCYNTRATGCQVSSAFHFKYTSCKSIQNSLKNSIQDPATLKLCPEPQSNPASLLEYIASKPAEDRVALLTQVYTAEELTVRGRALMNLTVDDFTKKITHLTISIHFTALDVI